MTQFATSTFQGQKLIKSIIYDKVLDHNAQVLKDSTIKEFELTNKEIKTIESKHRVDHIEKNVVNAKYYRDQLELN